MNAVEMVKAALAEAGYPDIPITRMNGFIALPKWVPLSVAWRAGAIVAPAVGERMCCFPCYLAADGHGSQADCDHDTFDGAPPVVRP